MNWFNEKQIRDIKLRSAVLLVAKNKSKRIKMFCSLTVKNEAGDPDWLADDAAFVMKHAGVVARPDIKVVGMNITMGGDNLFKKPVEAPKSEIRSFVTKQCGDAEEPDTVLDFTIYTTFSGDVWKWCGQMGGETFAMKFEGAVPEPGDVVAADSQLTLTSQEPKQDDPEPEEGDDVDPDEDLTGPEHDEAFGAKQAKAELKESQSSKAAKAVAAAKSAAKKTPGRTITLM